MSDNEIVLRWESTLCVNEPSEHSRKWNNPDCKQIDEPHTACIRLYYTYMSRVWITR